MIAKLEIIIKNIIENKGTKSIVVINPETSLRKDLGFDSLDLAELTVRIEHEFGVDVFENEIIDTIGQIIDKINFT
jgi:acyl carrier protein